MNNKILIYILTLIIVLSSLVSAGTLDHYQYQRYANNEGFIDEGSETGSYASDDITLLCSMADGMDYQSLTGNFDADSDTEFIIISSSSIKVYDNDCSISEELSAGLTLLSQPSMYNDTAIAFVGQNASGNNFMYLYGLNPIAYIMSDEIDSSYTAFTGVTCIEGNFCYALGSNTTESTAFKWNSTYTLQNIESSVKTIQSNYGSPAVNYFVSSTRYSVATSCDANANGQWGFCVFNADDLSLDTYFSTDGIFDDITYSSGLILNQKWINQPMLSSVTGGNNKLVTSYTTCKEEAGDDYISHIYMFNNDGSSYLSRDNTMADNTGGTCAGSASNQYASWGTSPVVKHNVLGTAVYCARWGYSTTGGLSCVDKDNNLVLSRISASWSDMRLNPVSTHIPLFSVNLLNDTTYRDLVTQFNIIDNSISETAFNFSNTVMNSNDRGNLSMSFDDFDADGSLDLLFTSSAGTVLGGSASFVDLIPTLTDTFGRSYTNPVCNNTALRFSAKEYAEENTQTSGTNYYNDINTQTERLVADCYGNGTLTYGNYSLANPYVDCPYTSIGTYYATIYLQDTGNSADLTQFDDVNILVIDGTAGITCNADSLAIGEDSIEGDAVSEDISNPSTAGLGNFLDFFTGGDANSQIFIGFALLTIIVLATGGYLASVTHSGVAVGIAMGIVGVAGFVCLTAIGLFPVWILVLIMLMMILGVLLKVGFMVGGG